MRAKSIGIKKQPLKAVSLFTDETQLPLWERAIGSRHVARGLALV
jgi:hypothetical protein